MGAQELLAEAALARDSGNSAAMRSALIAAFEAAREVADTETMAAAALALPSSQQFGVHPGQLPSVLHEAFRAADRPLTKCQLAAALARCWVYGGDAAKAAHFAAEAQRLANEVGTPEATADALEAALVAHWGPEDFLERMSLAARLEEASAHLTETEARLRAHLWRLTIAWESLDIVAVQRQLRALELLAEESASIRVGFFAVTRRAMHALATGEPGQARSLIDKASEIAAASAEPDADGVLHSLRSMDALMTGDPVALTEEANAYEAFGTSEGIASITAEGAVLWLAAGEAERAARLVAQLTPDGLRSVARDVDFLLEVTCIAEVAAALPLPDLAREAMEALVPFRGRGVLNAGAVTFRGVVDDYVYRLALVLNDPGSEGWRHAAENAYRRVGASWWAERLLPISGPRPRVGKRRDVTLLQEREGRWVVGAPGLTFTLPDLKGLHYVRRLVDRPGAEIEASELAALGNGHAGEIFSTPDVGDTLDATALSSYRQRLARLDEELDGADVRGDQQEALRLSEEREALLAELKATTGLGGRQRRVGASEERARVAVRKAVVSALAHIARQDPSLAHHLRSSIHTGRFCRYDTDPGDPIRWLTTNRAGDT